MAPAVHVLKGLPEITILVLSRTPVNDLEPLKGLTKLRTLHIGDCPNITEKQVDDLCKVLPNLMISKKVPWNLKH